MITNPMVVTLVRPEFSFAIKESITLEGGIAFERLHDRRKSMVHTFLLYSGKRLDNCVDVIGHYRKSVQSVNLSISVMQTICHDCRNSFVAQPNRADASAVKYLFKLCKPCSFKIGFHSFVMRRIGFSKVTQPAPLLLPLRNNGLRKRSGKTKCDK